MSCRLHHVRFFEPNSQAIHCFAKHPSERKLALSRNGASIEIWDLKGSPVISRLIPGTPSASVEAVCWVGNRLLSTGLSGAIIEWDLKKLIVKNSVLVTGNAAWCIDVSKQFSKIAVGTEQGYLNIYSVDDNKIEYEKIFDKQEGRILCCKFDQSGNLLVTGSIETIRIWNVSSGQALHRMNVGRSEKNKETIVWCLEVTRDLTVISGDSRGHLTFWDANIGEQIETINTHKADVLSICLSNDHKSLYCAGIDPLIINYTKIKMKHKGDNIQVEKWVKNIQRNIHQHDVRALVLVGNKLFSGGVDGYLAMSSFPPKVLVKYPPLYTNTLTSFCSASRIVTLKYSNYIELWQLGLASEDKKEKSFSDDYELENNRVDNYSKINSEMETYNEETTCIRNGRRVKISKNPKLILRLTAPSDDPIVCFAVADNNNWVAYSTEDQIRIFKLSMVDNSPSLSKLIPLPDECTPCCQMAFSPDSDNFIQASADANIKIFTIHSDGAVTIKCCIDTTEVLKDNTLINLSICESNDGGYYIVAADATSNIGIWRVGKDKTKVCFVSRLPQYNFVPSAMTINKIENNLIITYTDHKIVEYNLTNMRFTKWSENINNKDALCSKWWSRMFPITGLKVHPKYANIIMAYDDCGIYVFNKNKEEEEKIEAKRSKNNETSNNSKKVYYTEKKYKHLVAADWIQNEDGDTEAALVIVEPSTLLEKLPPAFFKHKFGCK